jgi:hypothetical protein
MAAAGAAGLPRREITQRVRVVVLCIAAGVRQNEDVGTESGRSRHFVAGDTLHRDVPATFGQLPPIEPFA